MRRTSLVGAKQDSQLDPETQPTSDHRDRAPRARKSARVSRKHRPAQEDQPKHRDPPMPARIAIAAAQVEISGLSARAIDRARRSGKVSQAQFTSIP